LVSGESHVRNLRMSLERARELGDDPIVGYLPDQFGHIGQMLRILRYEGLGWAMVWRGVRA
jgi:alpha-mannosidase